MKAGGGFIEDEEGVAVFSSLVSVASLIRWASPPESSVAGWPRRKIRQRKTKYDLVISRKSFGSPFESMCR